MMIYSPIETYRRFGGPYSQLYVTPSLNDFKFEEYYVMGHDDI
jgi:hypothetical protein